MDDFNSWILEKINKATISLAEKDSNYKAKQDKYTKLTYDFFKDLSEEQIKQFDDIIDLMGEIEKDELIVAYNTAVEQTDIEFNVPYYIVEEIIEYYHRGRPITKWDNIVALMRLAKANNKLTEEQIQSLIKLCK